MISNLRVHFQSKSTNFYITSTKYNKPGDIVTTERGNNSPPPNSTLNINFTDVPGIATITGVDGLYVSLNGSAPGTRLTWSNKEYKWEIKATGDGTNYIIPANGLDLYWFDALTIGTYVVVKAGSDVVPPDSEWIISFADNAK